MILLIAIVLILFLLFLKEGIPCIMYHGVGSESNLSAEEFEKQIKQIKNMNTYKFEEIEKFN